MANVINITDKIATKHLETRISRLKMEIDVHLKTITGLRNENFDLVMEISRLREENQELKKLLTALGTEITYG